MALARQVTELTNRQVRFDVNPEPLNPEPMNEYRLFNARVHEGLYELPLEQQKGNEQGGYGHQSGRGYD